MRRRGYRARMTSAERFVVNVEVALRRGESWLIIERGRRLGNAPGMLAFPGGKAEVVGDDQEILEATGRRELNEEVGLDLAGVPLRYATNSFFISDTGYPVIGVVFAGWLPDDAKPRIGSPEEVESVSLWTREELAAHERCPQWTLRNLDCAREVLER